jgi:hypothetical protein
MLMHVAQELLARSSRLQLAQYSAAQPMQSRTASACVLQQQCTKLSSSVLDSVLDSVLEKNPPEAMTYSAPVLKRWQAHADASRQHMRQLRCCRWQVFTQASWCHDGLTCFQADCVHHSGTQRQGRWRRYITNYLWRSNSQQQQLHYTLLSESQTDPN